MRGCLFNALAAGVVMVGLALVGQYIGFNNADGLVDNSIETLKKLQTPPGANTPTAAGAIATNRCPKGTFPAGGGYCRNIVCKGGQYIPQRCINTGGDCSYWKAASDDPDAVLTLKNHGKKCTSGGTQWGDTYIPMR